MNPEQREPNKAAVFERYIIEEDGKMRVEHPPFPPTPKEPGAEARAEALKIADQLLLDHRAGIWGGIGAGGREVINVREMIAAPFATALDAKRVEIERLEQLTKAILPIMKADKRDWVKCPICGEPDMRQVSDSEGNKLIFCVNHACASNGGPEKERDTLAQQLEQLKHRYDELAKREGVSLLTEGCVKLELQLEQAVRLLLWLAGACDCGGGCDVCEFLSSPAIAPIVERVRKEKS